MKTPIVAALMTLASFTATAASAYSFNPPNQEVRLRGRLTFAPNEGGDTPFKCQVNIKLTTKKDRIIAITFPNGDCVSVIFTGLPWKITITDANSGKYRGGGFESPPGNCVQGVGHFKDNGSGDWTFDAGECLSGTLTSIPPTTIIP